ncbi:RNA polymerase sigma factor [Geofilum rubicundum]|nr:RNA polymerase sigma factor [Geofilum rubicundum]
MSPIQLDIHKDIVEKARTGNSKAQRELYHLYGRSMYNICCRMMNNSAEAEDMLQEVFIEAFTRLDSFRFESTIGAWLKRITINKCINELRKRKVELDYGSINPNVMVEEEQEEDDVEVALSVDRIKHAMGLLPDGYRVVFSLYMLEGYDHEEISRILNISESTSKTQLLRGKKKIIEILKAGEIQTPGKN